MGNRDEILIQLYRLVESNSIDARIYYRIADKCNRSSLKTFYKKLSLQKRIFCRRIRYEIRELEMEMEQLAESKGFQKEFLRKNTLPEVPSLRNNMIGWITYCSQRETQYLHLYKVLLSETNLGNIREMLLSQKHSVQLVLNEIKTLETKIHKGINEEEINYS